MKIKKIAAIFLTAVIGVSCFMSCTDENNATDSSSAAQPPVEYTDYSLVADEQSDYTVVVSDTASKKAKTGQSEIVKFFYDATGCILPQATDEEVSYSAEAKIGEKLRVLRANRGNIYYFKTIKSDGKTNSEAEIEIVDI